MEQHLTIHHLLVVTLPTGRSCTGPYKLISARTLLDQLKATHTPACPAGSQFESTFCTSCTCTLPLSLREVEDLKEAVRSSRRHFPQPCKQHHAALTSNRLAVRLFIPRYLMLCMLLGARAATACEVHCRCFSTLGTREISVSTDGGHSEDAVGAPGFVHLSNEVAP